MADFDISELTQLADDLAAAGPKAKRISSEKMTKIAADLRDDARAAVAVDTGETKASIHIQGGQGYRRVIADSQAAFYLEFGTSDTAPQPFMWPAAATAGRAMAEAFAELGNPFD